MKTEPETMANCRLCGQAYSGLLHQKRHGVRYSYCRSCEVFFQNPLRDRGDARDRYLGEWGLNVLHYNAKEGYRRRLARRRLSQMRKAGGAFRSLLEVGCATGLFLDEARKLGIEVRGVELSTSYATHCARVMNLAVQNTVLAEAKIEGPLEAIAYWETFEHVLDPMAELERVRGLLAPRGLLALSVPFLNIEFFLQRARYGQMNADHIFLFSLPGLMRFLSNHGFEVLSPSGVFSKGLMYLSRAAVVIARKA
jgi:SAM-dependent methyltransferase